MKEAGSAQAARSVDPVTLACAILDLQLLDGDGTDVAAALVCRRPALAIAFFTSGAVPSLVESARCRGQVFLKPDLAPLVAWVKRTTRPSQPPPTK